MRRVRRDDGSATVEFAFLLPILLLLSVVAAEFGFAFVDWLAVSNATRTAARVGAAGGSDAATDTAIQDAVVDALSGAPRATLKSIEIYEVLSDGSQGNTHGYDYAGGAWTACSPCGWPPSARGDQFGSLDQMGVRVHFDHSWVIGYWSEDDAKWADEASIRIEPDFGA